MLNEAVLRDLIRGSGSGEVVVAARYEVGPERLFRPGRVRSSTVSAVLWSMFCVLFITITVMLVSSDGNVASFAGVPMPAIVLAGSFGVFVIFLWVVPVMYRRFGSMASRLGIRLFVVGATPFSRQFLVITESSIVLFHYSGRVIGSWPRREVVVTALKQFGPAVSLVITTEYAFAEIPIALEVGGPAAPFWSNGGIIGRHALRDALDSVLRESGYAQAKV
ncbi:hypothetical protein J7E25_13830 [Agromyces sp. ISL-38]|uniref:hypothetical protein n=1 Tax=Agromyces sp. ISL-38 TaxID=2819107 RepID=UPI001BE76C27|nr:hypothetical protein [Agromyces sp. ISL-38]MBT2500168.1 hypothetical protein [Agromyces sp. ISL-38]MBT2516834.1 hypothetical protein [Streptomyces sp. ISL-90]